MGMSTKSPKKKRPPAILIALPLAYQDGRDRYAGILQYLNQKNRTWDIHLVRLDGLSREVFEREMQQGIQGVIFNKVDDDAVIDDLRALSIPCVVVDAEHPELFGNRQGGLAFVDADSDEIGQRGADYLAAQGNYSSFGIIGYEADCNWSERRIQSFCKAIAAKGAACDVLRIRRTESNQPHVRALMREWGANLDRPAAVMAVHDELARKFMYQLTAADIRIPQDIAVLGVDNEWILCTHMMPTLSSVQPDFERSGFLAAQCLDKLLRQKNVSRRTVTPLTQTIPVKGIVGRESTAPSSSVGRLILKAQEFIHDYSAGDLHVDDVAHHLCVSRRLLDLRFRAVTGKTVLEAIRMEQLERVRHLLRSTAISITEIGRLCNFRSENHLKRLFKATFGITMRAYRIHNRK